MSLSAKLAPTRVEPETKEWVRAHAAKLDRTEGAVVRIALREYRAKVSRRERTQ